MPEIASPNSNTTRDGTTNCPVFSTYLCASRIDGEIEALVEEFEGQISSGKDRRFSVEGEWHYADDKKNGRV
jgi:hypothetical protein